MVTTTVKPGSLVSLGRQGENRVRRVVWPSIASEYAELYGDGAFALAAQRSGDTEPYPVTICVEGDSVVWVVSDADNADPGYGKCELTYLTDGSVAKSQTWLTLTLPSITARELSDPPEPQKGWVEQVLEAGVSTAADAASAKTDARSARKSADRAETAARSAEETVERLTDLTSSEEWIFELEDGTSVTKRVVLSDA